MNNRTDEIRARLEAATQHEATVKLEIDSMHTDALTMLINAPADIKFLLERVSDLEEIRQELATVQAERDALTDYIDLMVDEFMRIKSCPEVTDEIKGLCDRAISNIKQRVPVIVQRDKALAERNALKNSEEAALNSLALEKELTKTLTAERDALEATLKMLESRIGYGDCKVCVNWNDFDCRGCCGRNFEPIVPADALHQHDRQLLERFCKLIARATPEQYAGDYIDEFLEQEGKADA